MSDPAERAAHHRAVRAWCLYDVANSAFATSVVAAILPPFFAATAGHALPKHLATAYWGYASSAALMIAAVISPLLGAAADRIGRRKPILFACVLAGSAGTLALAFVPWSAWWLLLVAFGIAFIAFAAANVLYDSLLPSIAAPEEMHRVSARGFAWGYFGGGVLLAINLAWILMPQRFGMSGADAATRWSFASVALWWLGFSIPLFRNVPEPVPAAAKIAFGQLARDVVGQLARTIAEIRNRPDLLRFLIAFWLYSDGIGTIVKMATIYGSEVGIGRNDLIGALLMVQLLAAPASLAFGRLAGRFGPQRSVLFGLIGYVGISLLAFFLSKPWHFWLLAALVAAFQGGTQALSRSMFASLAPKKQVGEMFGFYSVSEKLAGVVGPLLFGIVAQLTGGGRWATLVLLPLFIGGSWLLMTVNLERGTQEANA